MLEPFPSARTVRRGHTWSDEGRHASVADPVDHAVGRNAGPEPNACHHQRVHTQREHRTPPEPDSEGTFAEEPP
jgi:hypothetical protein